MLTSPPLLPSKHLVITNNNMITARTTSTGFQYVAKPLTTVEVDPMVTVIEVVIVNIFYVLYSVEVVPSNI